MDKTITRVISKSQHLPLGISRNLQEEKATSTVALAVILCTYYMSNNQNNNNNDNNLSNLEQGGRIPRGCFEGYPVYVPMLENVHYLLVLSTSFTCKKVVVSSI